MSLSKEEIRDVIEMYKKEKNVAETIDRFEEIYGFRPSSRTVYRIIQKSGDFKS